jgi:HAMP domain-containing protein
MSEQTSERERLANDLDAMRVDHLVCAALTQWSLDRIEEAETVIRADATLHAQLGEARAEIAALRQRVEACEKQLGEARAPIDALRGRCRAAEAYALSLAEKVDEMEAHSEALAHSTPAPVVTEPTSTEVAAAPVIKHVWSDSDQGWVIDIRAMGQVVLVEIDVKEVGVAVLHGAGFFAYEPKDQPQASGVAATGEPPKGMEAKAESVPVAWQVRHFDFEEMAWSEFWRECSKESAALYRQPRYAGRHEVRDLYAAPAAPERAEGQRVTEAMVDRMGAALLHLVGCADCATNQWARCAGGGQDALAVLHEYEEYAIASPQAPILGEKPFDTTSPCGDPNVTVMARDAATGEPTMFVRGKGGGA